MTSPFSSNLLQQPVEAPTAPAHTRSVTRVVAAPQPQQFAPAPPQPIYVQAPAGGRAGSAITAVLLALVVILVGAVALVGSYYATKQASPSTTEAATTRGIAAREGFVAGRSTGIADGRSDALEFASTATALRAAAARQRAYATAYQRGLEKGRSSYRRPSYSNYRGGYSAPRYGGFRNADVYAAVGQAQNLANITGAPVDVEIYR